MNHRFAAITLATTMLLAACSKNNSDQSVTPTPATPTAVGFWQGKIGQGATLGLYYGVLLNKNGTMRAYQGGSDSATATKGECTWQLNGSTIKLNYKMNSAGSNTQATALSNEVFSSMTGSWELGVIKGNFNASK